MTSITKKKVNGRTYYYARECQRIDGKPTIVWQKYLGSAESIVAACTAAAPEPQEAFIHELGASGALLGIAEELDLAGIIDRHAPKRGAKVSVGTYLLIAAISRCLAPCSKKALGGWYETTCLERLLGPGRKQLSSQRFWDNMDRISSEALRRIERDLVARMVRHFQIDVSQLLFDATNFFTFIDSFNDRAELAQRGHSKEGRKSLRIVGLALLAAADSHVPVLHRTYPGNRPDAPTFRSLVDALVARLQDLDGCHDSDVTLVFDKGNNSADNIQALQDSPYHVIGSLVPTQHPDLLAVPDERFTPLEEFEGVRAFRTAKKVYGVEHTVVVVRNPNLEQTQTDTLLREIAKARGRLREVQLQLARWRRGSVTKGRRPTLQATRKKVDAGLKARHMKDLFVVTLTSEDDGLPRLRYRFDNGAWEHLRKTLLGKNLIFTDRAGWSDAQIVSGYRAQHHVERAFRDLKDTRHIAIRPQFHWTDQKIAVHVFICVLALMLQTLLHRRVREKGLALSCPEMLRELAAIREVAIVYADRRKKGAPKMQMTLSHLSDIQKKLYQTLDLKRWRAS